MASRRSKATKLTMVVLKLRERKLLEKLSRHDSNSMSATVRRLILEEARRRNFLVDFAA